MLPLPPSAAGRRGRLLVFGVGHESSGVPAEWAAGQGRPGVALAAFSAAGVRHLAELVAAHKQPGDLALVSGEGPAFTEGGGFRHALLVLLPVHPIRLPISCLSRPARAACVDAVHMGSNWGFGVPEEQRRFVHALIDRGANGQRRAAA